MWREAAAMHDEKWMQRRLAKVRYNLSQQRNPDIEAFVKKVLPYLDAENSKDKQTIAKLKKVVTSATRRLGSETDRLLGITTHGWNVILSGDRVLHVEKRHGTNGEHDTSMTDLRKWEQIPWIFKHFDEIEVTQGKSHVKGRDNKPAPQILIKKRVNGVHYIASADVDTKNKALHITSVFTGPGNLMIGPNANFKKQPSDYVQDALPPGDKKNISQNEENVNPGNLPGSLREGRYEPTAEEITRAKREYDKVVAKYKGTDKWIKAPNGKKSNLAERQWVQVRTPSFKKWFGDWEKTAEVYSIVNVQSAPFGSVSEAIEWVKSNGVIGVMTNEETGGKGEINISVGSIREMLNPRQREKSVSTEAHFAALTKLREIIRESKVIETHPDYKKSADGERSKENGINLDVEIDVLYGAIHFGNDVYRVKTRIKRYSQPSETSKAYSYQVSEIEVLPGTLEEAKSHTLPTDKTSITGNKLLQGMLNVNGNLILDHSKIIDENGEPLVVYHGSPRYGFSVFRGMSHFETKSSACDRLNDLIFDWEEEGLPAEPIYEVFLNIRNPAETVDELVKEDKEYYKDLIKKYNIDETLPIAANRKQKGHDGERYINIGEDEGSTSWVTYNPNQIKFTDNIGTFDARSNVGHLREGDLEAHLQARRDAMPKMGIEAARANVQAALNREPGETHKAWAKRKLKATSDFIVEQTSDARSPVIEAMREITGKTTHSERTDIPLAMQTSYGRVFAEHLDIDKNYMNPALKILADNGLDVGLLDTYLVAMHAPERNKTIKEHTTFGRNK